MASVRVSVPPAAVFFFAHDEVVAALPIRHQEDDIAIFSSEGYGKRLPLKDVSLQKRSGKGLLIYKPSETAVTKMKEFVKKIG